MDLSTQQNMERIAKFLSGNMTLKETELFHQWLEENPANRQLLQEALEVWQMGEEESIPDFDKDMDNAWTKVERHIQRETIAKPQKMRVTFRQWAPRVAASLALLVLAGWALFQWRGGANEPVVYATGPGETRSVVLPDSSKVWLNERTTLRRPRNFSDRNIQLEGEAFFEVRRMEESPFRIESGGAITEVLGTSFNIRAYPEESRIELTVETGKVAFGRTGAPESRVQVNAGSSAILEESQNASVQTEEKFDNAISWHTGKLRFEDATLEMVRLSFERFYDIRLEAGDPSIWKCHFTGAFDKVSPSELAETVAFSLNLDLHQTDSVYILSGKGCGGEESR